VLRYAIAGQFCESHQSSTVSFKERRLQIAANSLGYPPGAAANMGWDPSPLHAAVTGRTWSRL
jgi:hypothetical protein